MSSVKSPWGDGATKHFFELTPDTILDSVEKLGIRCSGRSLALNSLENRVYEVERDLDGDEPVQSPSDRFVIAKFYRPGRWTKSQIEQEHTFLLDLRDADIPVVAPYVDDSGVSVHEDKRLGLYYAIFPKVGGRSPDELDDEQAERVGRLLARMHGVGATKDASDRVSLTPETYGIDNLRWLIDHKMIPSEYLASIQTQVESICKLSDPWFKAAKTQRLHGDCHLGNLLWGQQGPFWVDFDDMVIGPPVQDIWLMIPGRDEWAKQKMRLVLKGYTMMRPFERSTLRLIEPLRALRFVHFAAWIGKRWEDQSFPKAFPHYGSTRYWQELSRDLGEQLTTMQEQPWDL